MSEVESTEVEKTEIKIKIDTEGYVKGKNASGSTTYHNGDTVATALQAMNLAETYAVAAGILDVSEDELQAKYGHLNNGQQRMNLGNRIRGAISKIDKANASTIAKLEEGAEQPSLESGAEAFGRVAGPTAEAAVERAGKEASEKEASREEKRKAAEAKKAEKAAAKAAAAKAKAEKAEDDESED